MPNSRASRDPRNVVALVYDGLCTFEFGLCAEVFGLNRPEVGSDWYSFTAVAAEPGRLHAAGGLAFTATGGQRELAKAGTIVVPGWRHVDEPVPLRMVEILREAHGQGARILTICSGVFALAATGLLDGHQATTHWRYVSTLRSRYGAIEVLPDRLYVEADRLTTSAGSAAGIDMLLHVVREDYGNEVVNSVARRLVMHSHRQGGQQQFVPQPVADEYEADRLSPLLDKIRGDLGSTFSVATLAAEAGMSMRTFQRRFVAMTGKPVGRWIAEERIAAACRLLENSALPMAIIAERSGLGSAENLQYHFRKRLDVSPGQYRARFRIPA